MSFFELVTCPRVRLTPDPGRSRMRISVLILFRERSANRTRRFINQEYRVEACLLVHGAEDAVPKRLPRFPRTFPPCSASIRFLPSIPPASRRGRIVA